VSYRNLPELVRRQAERLGPRPAVRYKRHGVYHDVTWDHFWADVLACAAALVDAGIQPGDRVAVFSENRVEWLIADLGLMAAAAINVPPHAPLTAHQVQFQLADAGVCWLFVSTAEQRDKIQQIRGQLPQLQSVVAFEGAVDDLPPGIDSWARFLQRGRFRLPGLSAELARREAQLGPGDLATVMYTSGTTGNPKGVMLTHGNLISNALATLEASGYSPDDVRLTWLPFSHIYARLVDYYMTLAGGVVVCLAESAETVIQDLQDVQPTHMSCVPRFYEKVLTAVASDDLLKTRRRLRDLFGPRIQWLASGGAALPLPIAEAYHAAGLPVYQGYGLTESSPVISFNRKTQNKLGTVGPALPGVEIAIAPDGEILSRGPHIMKGYWNDPQATAEAIRDGWLHTGDLGQLDGDGFLSITGRKKELLVLSNGKKVVPSYLEGLLTGDECIDQAVVCGEGRNYLTALIVPHWGNVRRHLPALAPETNENLVLQPAVQGLLRQRVDQALVNVSGAEQVRKFILLPQPFTVAADELTVSLKLRRKVVLGRHAAQLETLYRDCRNGPDGTLADSAT
jgi:long-chain acyl-CoA synthetase